MATRASFENREHFGSNIFGRSSIARFLFSGKSRLCPAPDRQFDFSLAPRQQHQSSRDSAKQDISPWATHRRSIPCVRDTQLIESLSGVSDVEREQHITL